MVTKKPTELELSVLSGYKHPAKSLQSLRKDLLIISQLTSTLKGYKVKKDAQQIRKALNLIIILSNLFEAPSLEYALYASMPNEFWPEVATLLFVLQISTNRNNVDKNLLSLIGDLRSER